MSAELWMRWPCKHGRVEFHRIRNVPGYKPCTGGSEEALDPDRVVTLLAASGPDFVCTVQDILDALEACREHLLPAEEEK